MDTILLKFVITSVLALSLVSVPYKNISAESVVQYTLPELGDSSLKVETVYQGISFPSAMSFLGSNDILVLEKDQGTVKRIVNGVMIQEPLLDAAVSSKGERGMLGIAISENPSNNNKGSKTGEVTDIFLYYTESSIGIDDTNGEPLGSRVYRYQLSDNQLINEELILDILVEFSSKTGYHVGGNLVVGSDEKLYVAVGDMGTHETESQNILGKEAGGSSAIYKITKKGQAAPENPIQGEDIVRKFYAYGIRNSFGMDIDPVTGNLWDTENGPEHGDEINLVEPGFNSGWKQVQGMSILQSDFDENTLVDFNGTGKYSDPEFVWNNTVGPTALKFLDSEVYGTEYQDDIFVGDVKYGNLYHFDLNNARNGLELTGSLKDKIANNSEERESVIFGRNFGGIVDLEISPDGYLYVLAIARLDELTASLNKDSGTGTVYRIVPSNMYNK
jgi:glucose/arabinose dehydrogenase